MKKDKQDLQKKIDIAEAAINGIENYLKATKEDKQDLQQRRGFIVFSKEVIINSNEDALKAIFNEFYPINIQYDSHLYFANNIIYYGYSAHFDLINEDDPAKRYDIVLRWTNDGVGVEFKEIIKY